MHKNTRDSALKRDDVTPPVVASIRGVCKTFADKPALKNVNLDIRAGQVLAILGANGAGKTTLINTMLGRLKVDAGTVTIFGQPPGSVPVKRQTGALLQVASLPETLKVKEHIELFRSYYPAPMPFKNIIAYAGLEALQNRFSKKLSGGEKQRLLFALSICGDPKLLFLDEPSVGMDISARQSLWGAIRDLKEQGTAIVLTTHYLEEADNLADMMVMLKGGEIIQQGTADYIKSCVSSTIIRFMTTANTTDYSAVPGVVDIAHSGKFTTLQSTSVNQTLLALLTQQPELQDLSVSPAGLEQAFLHLNQTQQITGESYP